MIFTFIPLALMAAVAYFRAQTLLREQASEQTESLLANQVEVVTREIQTKENIIKEQFSAEDAPLVFETALHANPQSSEFRAIRARFMNILLDDDETNNNSYLENFDAFLLVDSDGLIRLASNADWQGSAIDSSMLDFDKSSSQLLYGLSPIYDSTILMTAVHYQTERGSTLGTLIGVTESENLSLLLQPLNGLAPYARAYFVLLNEKTILASQPDGTFNPVAIPANSNDTIINTLDSMRTQIGISAVPLDVPLENEAETIGQIMWLPAMQSGILLATNAETVYGQINSLLPFTILLVLGAVFAMGVVLYYGTQRVIRPLQLLSSITRKFAEGDWSQRAEVTGGNEISELSNAFNYLADQIEENYKSLESKVEERALQIRTAAEVAQNITTIPNLDEMLAKTVELLVQQFGFYQASIFLVERSGRFVEFKSGYGSATQGLLERKYSLPVGAASIIGWVAENNQARVASDVAEDPLHLKSELLPETRSEACVPIALGSNVLGVLDVQSTQPSAFSADTIVMLQTLASQVAAAIQTAGLVESSQINFQELDRLYRSSRVIAEAKNSDEVFQVSGQILKSAPYPVILFKVDGNILRVVSASDMIQSELSQPALQNGFPIPAQDLELYLSRGSTSASISNTDMPKALGEVLRSLDLPTASFIPVKGEAALEAIIMIGSRQQKRLGTGATQPYENLSGLMSVALQRASAVAQTERHLQEVESLVSINELVSSAADMQGFFRALLSKIQQIIGDYNLIVSIYDEESNMLEIPFSYENGKLLSILPFPLGEGLTSILIRTRQPLLLVKDTERRMTELGAKIVGRPAKSWMGAPMLLRGEPIGALIIQDLDHEEVFDENDLKFFTTIAGQVAGVIKNVQLLDKSKQNAVQLEAAAEIARDISTSLNLDELLQKAVKLIRERFNFYHAGIFLLDQPGEFAVIREATGEAGSQMKRQGYKIGVGSKSIVGYVTGKGEMLVVSDTQKDLTYYANPLLPDTRAEAAIPLRIGERILGALDVQSTQPYAFREDSLKSLQILADQLAIAVANSELFAETQEHLSQHRLLHHITTSAASGTTLEEALESAVKGLQVTLGGDRVMILLTDRDKLHLEVKAAVGYAEDISKMKVEVGKGVTGWVAAHRRPLRLHNVHEDPRYIETSANTKSELAVPLIYRNEVLGVINVESEQQDAYSENDEEMLGTLGGSLAAVIANARLVEQIRAQSERERLINEITGKIRRSSDIQSILYTTASEIARVTGARFTKIQVQPEQSDSEEERK